MTEAEQNRLIVANMALVAKVAADFRGSDIEYEDLIGVGREGLVKAARAFDPKLGKFSGYASGRIRTEILNAIRSGDYAKLGGEEWEDVKEWSLWGNGGNARAIYETWEPDFDGDPERLSIHYDDIRHKAAQFEAAFISLTPMERKAVQLVYLRDPQMSIAQASREMRTSYKRVWLALERALKRMHQIINSMEQNSGIRQRGPSLTAYHGKTGTVAA